MITNHAKKRSIERMGEEAKEEKIAQVIKDIQENRAIFICHGNTKSTAFYVVLLDGKDIPILYSKKTRSIVTIYHRTQINYLLRKQLNKLSVDNRSETA